MKADVMDVGRAAAVPPVAWLWAVDGAAGAAGVGEAHGSAGVGV